MRSRQSSLPNWTRLRKFGIDFVFQLLEDRNFRHDLKEENFMEKCFIIESSAELHKDYYDWVALRDKNNEIIKNFVAENITERYPFTYMTQFGGTFGITLTNEEYEKFKSQLKKDYTWTRDNEPLYTFKKNSNIGKRYAELNIKPADKPYVPLILGLGGRWRLFDYEGVLYVTYDSETMKNRENFPDGWQEISKGEFYSLLDKIEKETD